jgi:putative ABC transport system permease protein
LRGLLVISELTLSLMLLIGAGLLVRSFVRLQSVPPGFSTAGVLTMQIAANDPKYRDEKARVNLYRDLEQRVSRLPGVKSEGVVSALPLTGAVGWGGIQVEGYTPLPGRELQVDIRTASTDYFRTMGIPLIKGRFFSEYDTTEMPPVVIIDEKFAQRFWPNDNPIGKHLWFDPKKPITIVGVVGVVKQYGLETDDKIAT